MITARTLKSKQEVRRAALRIFKMLNQVDEYEFLSNSSIAINKSMREVIKDLQRCGYVLQDFGRYKLDAELNHAEFMTMDGTMPIVLEPNGSRVVISMLGEKFPRFNKALYTLGDLLGTKRRELKIVSPINGVKGLALVCDLASINARSRLASVDSGFKIHADMSTVNDAYLYTVASLHALGFKCSEKQDVFVSKPLGVIVYLNKDDNTLLIIDAPWGI